MTNIFRAFLRAAALLSLLTAFAVTPAFSQKINPTNQINWPLASGSGAPAAACTSVNYGQPYSDITGHVNYTCGNTGWFQSSGSGGSGVASINGTAGAFTFNFASGAGSCSGTTCTFSGASGGVTQLIAGSGVSLSPTGGTGVVTVNATGAIAPGTLNHLTYYSATGSSVASDNAFSVTTPSAMLTDQLVWVGGGGASFTNTNQGGSFNFAASDLLENTAPSQINISTNIENLNEGTNPGQISITTSDSGSLGTAGNSNAANILISANETTGATLSNSGNVTISAAASYASEGSGTTNSGDVNINAANPNGIGGNIALNASSPGGGNIALTADAGGGRVSVAGRQFVSTADNFLVDASGNITLPVGSVSAAQLIVNDTSGVGGGLNSTQGTAPSGVSGSDLLWADATAGRWKMNNNNGPNLLIPGVAAAGTPGDLVMLASNGIDPVDATSSPTVSALIFKGSTSGQVTIVPQAVAGTPTLQLPTVNGQIALTSAEVVAFSATPTFTASDGMSRMVLSGNVTSFTMGSAASGTPHVLCFEQDATGGHTVTAPANVHGFMTISATASKWNCQPFMYDATDSIWLATSTGVTGQ